MKKTQIALLLFSLILSLSSCNGLFRESPINKLSEDRIWANSQLLDGYVLPWYRGMSNGFSVYMPTKAFLRGISREYLPWYGDQITVSKSEWMSTAYGDILGSGMQEIQQKSLGYWTKYYGQIRSINFLLENSDQIPEGSQKDRVLGEAHFFRAYYYYLLLRRFGAPLLIEETYDPIKNPRKFPRSSYEEMVEFIVAEAELGAKFLPKDTKKENVGRISQGAALMLKAKTYFWVSAERFQNQTKNYLGFTDDRSDEMLENARKAYDELINLGQYSLIQLAASTQEEIVTEYRQIFLRKNSEESILELQHSDNGDFADGFGHKLDKESVSPFYGGVTAAYTPTQNHVDEYGMQEGKTYQADAPYEDRDFRFYANVLFDGSSFRGRTMEIHYKIKDGEETPGADLFPYGASETAAVSKTGYYLGKFVDQSQQIDNNQTYASKQNYIIWRYAELLLDYAEIDFKQGRTTDALDKINQIRSRVKMPALTAITWDDIVKERRVELAFEETSYWDVLRYHEAVEKFSGSTNPLKKMKVIKEEGKPTIYQISNLFNRPARTRRFLEMQYYAPIPWDEIRYQGIEQNPDWVEQ